MQKSSGFFGELRRRNVIRMAGLYAVAAWLIVQVSGTVLPMFDAPAWLPRSLVFLLALGFIPALVFSWVFELTPAGLRREGEVPAEHSIKAETGQRMNHMIIAVLEAVELRQRDDSPANVHIPSPHRLHRWGEAG